MTATVPVAGAAAAPGVQAVTRRSFRKEATMRSKLSHHRPRRRRRGVQPRPDMPRAGLSAVNVPVVIAHRLRLRRSGSGGALAPGEAARLDAWFRASTLRYGDTVFVDGLRRRPCPRRRWRKSPAITGCWSARRSGHGWRRSRRARFASSSAARAPRSRIARTGAASVAAEFQQSERCPISVAA